MDAGSAVVFAAAGAGVKVRGFRRDLRRAGSSLAAALRPQLQLGRQLPVAR